MWGHTFESSADRQPPRGSGAGSELTQTPPHPRQDTSAPSHNPTSHWDGLPEALASAAPTKPTCKDHLYFPLFPLVPVLAGD